VFSNPESMNIPSLVRHLTGVVVLLLALNPLHAQETQFFVEDLTAQAGGEISVAVKAVGMQDLVGVQLSIEWDLEKLSYVGVADIILNGTPEDNFNRTLTDSARIGFLLIDNSLVGFGLKDTVLLFHLKLMPTSINAMTTEVGFGDAPLRFSAMDNDNNRLDCNKTGGTIELESPSGLISFAEDARFRVSPNPFTEAVTMTSHLNYAADGRLEVLDLSGRLLYSEAVRVPTGSFSATLPASRFPASGAYLLRLVTDREQLHRKVIMLE